MKQFVLTFCMVFSVATCANGQGYVITGKVKGADGKTVSLKQSLNLQQVEVSSTTVQNGKFTLKGDAPYPEFCMLYVDDQGPVQFFVENSNIQILIDMKNIGQAKVTGSKENEIFMEFMNEFEKFAQQQKRLIDSYVTMSASSKSAPDALTKIRTQMEELEKNRNAYMISFVQKYPDKISTAYLVSTSMMHILDREQLDQTASGFDAKTDQSQWVKMLKEQIAWFKRLDIGQTFPDITLKTPDDKPISISDYAGKGKYVLLDFWASWCAPCLKANPYLVDLYQRYNDKGFEIVGISLDQNKEAWIKAIKKYYLTWPHMSDLKSWESAAAMRYSVKEVPYTVLLDKDGKIIAKRLNIEDLTAKLAEIFGN